MTDETLDNEVSTAQVIEFICGWFDVALDSTGCQEGDNLYSLGGDSVSAVELAESILIRFGVDVPAELIMTSDHISAMAMAVAKAHRQATP